MTPAEELRAAATKVRAIAEAVEDVEWGVRYQIPGEHEQTKTVGSRDGAEDLIHELWLRHGTTGERIGRRVGPWEEM